MRYVLKVLRFMRVQKMLLLLAHFYKHPELKIMELSPGWNIFSRAAWFEKEMTNRWCSRKQHTTQALQGSPGAPGITPLVKPKCLCSELNRALPDTTNAQRLLSYCPCSWLCFASYKCHVHGRTPAFWGCLYSWTGSLLCVQTSCRFDKGIV